jgi:hypothetical protein
MQAKKMIFFYPLLIGPRIEGAYTQEQDIAVEPHSAESFS